MIKQLQKSQEIQLSGFVPAELRKSLKAFFKDANIPEDKANLLILAVDEIVTSVANYSKFKGYKHPIVLRLDIDSTRFKAQVVDPMTIFDFKEDLDLPKERRYKLSFFLVRQIVDELHYSYQRGFENKIELLKFL
jgi:anti-sigma regulatory factor (Ser/Thr protein kinase)